MDGLPKEARRGAAAFGPFAAVSERAGPGWSTLDALLTDPTLVAAKVTATQLALADTYALDQVEVETKVAASLMQLGLTARLTTVALGIAATSGWVPSLAPSHVWLVLDHPSPIPLAVPEPVGRPTGTPRLAADAIVDLVIEPAVRPVVELVCEVSHVSTQVLWGNVWSGLVGALGPLSASRPQLAETASEIVRELLAHPTSADPASTRQPGQVDAGGRYRRTTCCLMYRLPTSDPLLCADCVLR